MGRFYKTVEVPFIDYTYKYPYQELLGALEYKQGRQDKAIEKLYTERDKLYNIDYVPGSENEQYLKQKQKAFDAFLNNASRADLSGNTGWLEAETDKFAGDPELLDIQYNADWWQKQQEIKQAYEEKGIWNPNIQPDLVAGARTGQRLVDTYQPLYDWRTNAEQLFNHVPATMATRNHLNSIANKAAPEFSQSGAGIQAIEQLRRLQGDQYGKIYTDKTFAEMTDVEVAREAIEPARQEREDNALSLAQQELAAGDTQEMPVVDNFTALYATSTNEDGTENPWTLNTETIENMTAAGTVKTDVDGMGEREVMTMEVGGDQYPVMFDPRQVESPVQVIQNADGSWEEIEANDPRYNEIEARNQSVDAKQLREYYNGVEYQEYLKAGDNYLRVKEDCENQNCAEGELEEALLAVESTRSAAEAKAEELEELTGLSAFYEYDVNNDILSQEDDDDRIAPEVHPYYKALYGDEWQETLLDPDKKAGREASKAVEQYMLNLRESFKSPRSIKFIPKSKDNLTFIGNEAYWKGTWYFTEDEGDAIFPTSAAGKLFGASPFPFVDDWVDKLVDQNDYITDHGDGKYSMSVLVPASGGNIGELQTNFNKATMTSTTFNESYPMQQQRLATAIASKERQLMDRKFQNRFQTYVHNFENKLRNIDQLPADKQKARKLKFQTEVLENLVKPVTTGNMTYNVSDLTDVRLDPAEYNRAVSSLLNNLDAPNITTQNNARRQLATIGGLTKAYRYELIEAVSKLDNRIIGQQTFQDMAKSYQESVISQIKDILNLSEE